MRAIRLTGLRPPQLNGSTPGHPVFSVPSRDGWQKKRCKGGGDGLWHGPPAWNGIEPAVHVAAPGARGRVFDRKYLAARSRRFLRNYLNADDRQKPGYYRMVVNASAECRPKSALSSPGTNDAEIAEVTSDTALAVVLERVRARNNDRADDFVTDAYATVGVAYHRAAGLYSADRTMQKLGTAAVHLLTMATSYSTAQNG